jgi:two-component system, NarL family, sensor kinase
MYAVARRLLQIPLRWKLVGANALLLSAGLIVLLLSPQQTTERVGGLAILCIAAAVNIVLVYLALVPLATIQSVAEAVTKGDYDRRVPPMLLADSDADRSRLVFNNLLDHLAAENARVRRMAGDISQAREVERHAIAHELREGVAQLLFALTLELGATAGEQGEPLAGARARAAYAMANEAMEDLRRLAGTLAPAALGELGIQPALETLVRRVTADHDGPTVSVIVDPSLGQPPELVAQMLYRVAERAVRNFQSHGETKRALVMLRRRGAVFELDVEDDGVGVDLDSHDPLSAEPGLFGLREMLSQAGGDLRFECMRGERGTRVLARLAVPRPVAA